MAYHLSDIKIIYDINQQDTSTSLKLHAPKMNITLYSIIRNDKVCFLIKTTK